MARVCLVVCFLLLSALLVIAQRRAPTFGRGGPVDSSRPASNSPASASSNAEEDDDSPAAAPPETGDFVCPRSDGLFPDVKNCRKFHLCGNNKAWIQTCPPSLFFDSKLKYCTFKTDALTCGPINEDDARQEEKDTNQDALPICDVHACKLPNCFCSNDGTLIPGNLEPSRTPQMVLINFSGALNDLVFDHYRRVLGYSGKYSQTQSRKNPNGCGIKATFFVNHEYSNYAQIQWFAAQGHEVGAHSITHRQPETWWTDIANYSSWAEEMIGMREILVSNAGGTGKSPVLTRDNILGMRAPFIKPGGNPMFEMAHDFGFLYDSSIAAPRGTPPYWPFTYDFRQPFDCSNSPKKDESNRGGPEDPDAADYAERPRQRFGRRRRSLDKKDKIDQNTKEQHVRVRRQTPFLGRALKCPTRSFPGLWEVPINPLYNEFNTCHHADQCVFPSASEDDDYEAIIDFLKENFERHYTTNRAPFQLNFHVTWFTQKRNVRALNKFMEYMLSQKDVWFVTFQEMLKWVKNPLPIGEVDFKCATNSTVLSCNRPHTCVVKHYLAKDGFTAGSSDNFSRSDTRYMPVCHSSLCPQQYQWYGNTNGKKTNFKTIMELVDESSVAAPPASDAPVDEATQ